MTTKLDGALKRELLIGKQPYTLTISPAGLTLVLKGRRKGLEIEWVGLVSGDAALATSLNASLTANIVPQNANLPSKAAPAAPPKARKKRIR